MNANVGTFFTPIAFNSSATEESSQRWISGTACCASSENESSV